MMSFEQKQYWLKGREYERERIKKMISALNDYALSTAVEEARIEERDRIVKFLEDQGLSDVVEIILEDAWDRDA